MHAWLIAAALQVEQRQSGQVPHVDIAINRLERTTGIDLNEDGFVGVENEEQGVNPISREGLPFADWRKGAIYDVSLFCEAF